MSAKRLSITLDERLVSRLDELSNQLYTTRSGLITMFCSQGIYGLEKGADIVVKAVENGQIDGQMEIGDVLSTANRKSSSNGK